MAQYTHSLVLVTQKEYVHPPHVTPYISQVLQEDQLVTDALEQKGFRVTRTFWDDPCFDWSSARFALIRATWDYFHRADEFTYWLERRSHDSHLINPLSLVQWNMDKHYLAVLERKGVPIPPTIFLEQGDAVSLDVLLAQTGWEQGVLKPAVSGAARHTYLIDKANVSSYQATFNALIAEESMLLQEFQKHILTRGEVSHMVFGGRYSHSVLKRAKEHDFRVQDDFGGSVHAYTASEEEIEFATKAIAQCPSTPIYARVDTLWDNTGSLCLSELELIDPELWFRFDAAAAHYLADAIYTHAL